MPRPSPESSFQLSASSSELCPCPVACILSAFICQINSQKGKPNLRFETISAGKVRTTNQPPCSSFTLPPSPTYKRTVPLPFFVLQLLLLQLLFAQRAVAATSALLCSAQLGQHTICDNSFLRINICSACVPVLLGPHLLPPFLPLTLSNPIPDRLRFYLPRCPARPGLPFVCSVCFRTLFKLTCAYFLMLSCVCVWKVLLLPEKVLVHCDLRPQIIIFNTVLIV